MRQSTLTSVFVLAGSAAFLSIGMNPSVSAAVIGDDFTNNATNRASGNTLNGAATEQGNATWGARRFIFTNDNAVTPNGNGASAWVNAPDITGTITVETEVDVSNLTGNWGGLYLAVEASNGTYVTYGDLQLVLTLTKDGNWGIYYDGTDSSHKINSGNVVLLSGYNQLSVTYDSISNTVSAAVNGADVLANHDLGNFTPNIQTGGIMDSGEPGAKFDNFKLTTTTVPEPASLVFMGLGGLLLVRQRR